MQQLQRTRKTTEKILGKFIIPKKDWQRIRKWIKKKGEYPKQERRKLIELLAKDSLGELIEKRKSFGVIEPKIVGVKLLKQKEATEIQTSILDLDFQIINQKDFKFKPYVEYECVAECSCKNSIHKQQIVEWGCYEWMRKNPNSEEHCQKVFDNLRLTDKEWSKYFLVGNIHKSPKTYVIVGVLRFKNKE